MLLLVIKDSEVVLQSIMRSTKKVLPWIYAEKGVGFEALALAISSNDTCRGPWYFERIYIVEKSESEYLPYNTAKLKLLPSLDSGLGSAAPRSRGMSPKITRLIRYFRIYIY